MTKYSVTLGLDTFGDVLSDDGGTPVGHAETIRGLVEHGVLADHVGLDFFGIGEHHTVDMPLSAPDVVLAAVAARTSRIRLGSAVTVLSSDDPVRVFQRYSTLDALSHGRAEVILGRGSSTESFPLFGYDLGDYDELFDEKVDLFSRLLEEKPVTWSGRLRPSLSGQEVVPHTETGPIPAWIGVGGSPESVLRTAKYGMSLMLAIIGGPAARFKPFADLFRDVQRRLDKPQKAIGLHMPGHIADSDEDAMEELYPHYVDVLTRVARERGFRPPSREQFLEEVSERGAWHVGSPETVARKIAASLKTVGATRFDLKYGLAGLPRGSVLRNIELYGTRVAPMVRDLMEE
ncbi:Atu2307/SP_0267 family LLM class monooxygenase [Amycolatopsis sp. DSM 110486]|uniref:Atu2307/SP_0267 family LLM class monooxygenase n=1 Tax=Amycolatopsis sp. DSM 110486 TaxID=2865832 RepID=UPI001C69CAE4|nr:Atu2307/SP_0267 family LLM class monooxygenase [Amycolatopsis sp. DSM 110486]QYN22286.1 LLM class flavin-dependent oxidoreductase [Amycolatopsis sp. DSM 110486]